MQPDDDSDGVVDLDEIADSTEDANPLDFASDDDIDHDPFADHDDGSDDPHVDAEGGGEN